MDNFKKSPMGNRPPQQQHRFAPVNGTDMTDSDGFSATFRSGNDESITLTERIVREQLLDDKTSAQVSTSELIGFIKMCQHNGLDPFKREAFLVKYQGRAAQYITACVAFERRAESNPAYDGMEAGIVVKTASGEIEYREGSMILPDEELLGGYCNVYRKDRSRPSNAIVSFREYNKGQSTWKEIPATMIRKVAKVHALREAFPIQLGGLYAPEEMGTSQEPEMERYEAPALDYQSTRVPDPAEYYAQKQQQPEPEPVQAQPIQGAQENPYKDNPYA